MADTTQENQGAWQGDANHSTTQENQGAWQGGYDPAGGWTHNFNGVANANISEINGVAKASISKVNGA